jgi:hypothetical protein
VVISADYATMYVARVRIQPESFAIGDLRGLRESFRQPDKSINSVIPGMVETQSAEFFRRFPQ